jgi:putative DNA primase/helicase
VRHFIELNGEARFDPIDAAGDTRGVQNRAGWRRTNGEHREWLILPETWKTEICAGYDSIATARALADRGMLNADPAGKFQRSERTPYGSKRVYVVTSEILEGSDHAQ